MEYEQTINKQLREVAANSDVVTSHRRTSFRLDAAFTGATIGMAIPAIHEFAHGRLGNGLLLLGLQIGSAKLSTISRRSYEEDGQTLEQLRKEKTDLERVRSRIHELSQHR